MTDLKDIAKNLLNIEEITEIDFKKIHGFYFAFKTTYLFINDQISSSQIIPTAIIYKENDEYYLVPLHDEDKIEEIVKNLVEKCLIKEE